MTVLSEGQFCAIIFCPSWECQEDIQFPYQAGLELN